MARLEGIPSARSGLGAKIVFFFTRRNLAKISGSAPERMLEPLELYAYSPGLLKAYGRIEQATAAATSVDSRYAALATIKTATLVTCEYCIDLGSQIFRRLGLSDDELLALPTYRTSPLFDDVDRVVMDYAVGMTRTPADVSDELFARLAERFTPTQLTELTHMIALENMRGRFGIGLGVGAAGFSEGMVCAVPVRPD